MALSRFDKCVTVSIAKGYPKGNHRPAQEGQSAGSATKMQQLQMLKWIQCLMAAVHFCCGCLNHDILIPCNSEVVRGQGIVNMVVSN